MIGQIVAEGKCLAKGHFGRDWLCRIGLLVQTVFD